PARAVFRDTGRSAGACCREPCQPDVLGCESVRIQNRQDRCLGELLAAARIVVLHVGGGRCPVQHRMVYVSPQDDVINMRFSFDTYWPALLLLIIPYVWWVQRRTQTDLSPKHLKFTGIVRSAIVALIALALMQPVIY